MFQLNLVGAFVLAIIAVGVRCQSGEDSDSPLERSIGLSSRLHLPMRVPSYDYDFGRSCEAETQMAMAEVKSEIQDLQKLLVGLRQKLDPDFKLPPPRKFASFVSI